MSNKKIVELAQYRNMKSQTDKKSGSSDKDNLSFDEKLKDLIHRPLDEMGTKNDLIAIFEEEQIKKDRDNEE